MRDPLLAPLVAVMTGILLSRCVHFGVVELALASGALWLLSLAATRLAWGCRLPALLMCGILLDIAHRPGPAPSIDAGAEETVILSGCVVDPPIFYLGRDQFTLRLGRKASARVTLAIREGESPPELHYGQLVEVEARVRPIRNFRNPGSFDYAAWSATRGIYWTAAARAGSPVRVLPGTCGSRFMAGVFALRTLALQRLDGLYEKDPYAIGMMEGILLGESTKLEKIWTDHFRRTGTFHALVISGLHVTVLAGFLLFLLRLCFVPELPALAMTALAAWVYALVSGWSAPVVRAAAGFTLYLVARYFHRRGRVMNLLAAIALGFLILDPDQLFDASFQLSFLSVAAIGALAAPLMNSTSRKATAALLDITAERRDLRLAPWAAQFRIELRLLAEALSYYLRLPRDWWLRAMSGGLRLMLYVYDMVVISTCIQIGLALPMAIYFHRISFTGLSANVIIVPLLSLVVPVGFVAVFTGWHLPALLADWLLVAAEKVAVWHVQFEPAWRVPDPPLWLSASFVAALLAFTFALRGPKWTRWPALAAVLTLFGLVFVHPFAPEVTRGELEMTTIDVGQGDSVLLAFPDGKLMAMDAGGIPSFGKLRKPRIDIGEDVVSPYLWSRSIRRLDVVALTHAHEDHSGGLAALIDNFHPKELWTGAMSETPEWAVVRDKARVRGVKVVKLVAGQTFAFGGVRVEVLSPPDDYVAPPAAKNDDSLVLRLTYGQRSFLLTGDMEKGMEARAIYDGRELAADVLKVAHHGSKSSTTELFLEAVHPQWAIISDGVDNQFHHPHPDVLARLAAHHAGILRTDRLGLVTVRTDGKRIALDLYQGAGWSWYPVQGW
jgi:competence protein ComEC